MKKHVNKVSAIGLILFLFLTISPGRLYTIYAPIILKQEIPIEQQVLTLINAQRANCTPLVINAKLQKAAIDRSNINAQNGTLVHTDLNIIGTVYGYSWSALAENIAAGQTTAPQVVQSWMNSKGHKENIVNCTYTETGISRVGNYWTQVFGKPK